MLFLYCDFFLLSVLILCVYFLDNIFSIFFYFKFVHVCFWSVDVQHKHTHIWPKFNEILRSGIVAVYKLDKCDRMFSDF